MASVVMFLSPSVMLETRVAGLPWWAWILIILALVIFLTWLMGRGPRRDEVETPLSEHGVKSQPMPDGASGAACTPSRSMALPDLSAAAEPVIETVERAAAVLPDDLKIVEGIGPKIEGILRAAGITTFAQLAVTDVEKVREILTGAGLSRIADPTTWGEQAALAAAGKWDELKEFQGALKGGRRVSKD